jgi:nanoRNase/pAp phosphatase (c-di-AMP/oligoRNAs hydrolase)
VLNREILSIGNELASYEIFLIVKERKSGDEVIQTIKSGLNQVLGVMAEKFKGGKHGNAAVLELR